jgi:hypothetical protein
VYLAGSRPSPNNLYRVAAVVMALLAAGHTYGAVLHTPRFDAAAGSVRDAMTSVTFPCDGAICTWFGFYLGFAIMISVFTAICAFAAWYVGGLERSTRLALRPVIIAMALAFVAMAVVCKLFFFAPPLVLSAASALVLGVVVARFP